MKLYGYCVVVMHSGNNRKLYHPNRVHRSRIVETIEKAEMIKLEWASWEDSGFFELEIVTLYTNEIFDEPVGYIHKDDLSKLLSETGNHLTVGLDTRRAWPVGFGESKPYDHLSPIYTTPQNAVVNEQLLTALEKIAALQTYARYEGEEDTLYDAKGIAKAALDLYKSQL